MKKKILALLLCAVLVLGILPVAGGATGPDLTISLEGNENRYSMILSDYSTVSGADGILYVGGEKFRDCFVDYHDNKINLSFYDNPTGTEFEVRMDSLNCMTSAGTILSLKGVVISYTWDGSTGSVSSVTCTSSVECSTTPSGAGTAAEPYLIGTLDELTYAAIASNMGYSNYTSAHYELTADIGKMNSDGTVKEGLTTPICKDKYFKGVFDGKGHTVVLNINEKSGNAGLFGELYRGSIIRNVVVDGVVSGYGLTGGICGYVISANIINCVNKADVTGAQGSVGGICGGIWGNIENCFSCGSVTVIDTSYASVGGIAATLYDVYFDDKEGTTTNCYYTTDTAGAPAAAIGKNEYAAGTNVTDTMGITSAEAKAASGTSGALVDLLNRYIEDNAPNTDNLIEWVLGKDGYPTLFAPSDGPSVSIEAEKTSVYPSEIINIPVTISDAEGYAADLNITFDSALVAFSACTGLPDSGVSYLAGTDSVHVVFTNIDTADDVTFTLAFTVVPGQTEEKTAVFGFDVCEFADDDAALSPSEAIAVTPDPASASVTLIPLLDVEIVQIIGKTGAGYVAGYMRLEVTGALDAIKFAGHEMYLLSSDTDSASGKTLNTFGYILDPEEFGIDLEDTEAEREEDILYLLTKGEAPAGDLSQDTDVFNVNGSTKFDIADVRAVYNCQLTASGAVVYSVEQYMPIYLRADVNVDGEVDALDVSKIVDELLK